VAKNGLAAGAGGVTVSAAMKTLLSKFGLRKFKLAFALAVLLFVAVCGIKHMENGILLNGPSVNLPNGTTLTLKSVSLGNKHPEPFGKAGAFYYTPNSTLALWTYQTARPDGKWPEDVYLTVADESGVVHLPPGIGNYSCLTTNCMGERMEYNPFAAFPRRAKTLTFYVHTVTNSGWMIVGSFKIPNPARRSFPVWQSEPLPATRTNGGMEFSLTALKVRTNTLPDAATEAMFNIASNGVPATDWQVESLQLSDATDNQLDLWSGDSLCAVASNGLFFATNRWLGLDEPAWKLHVEFSHKTGYGADELASITNVPAILDAYIPDGSLSATLKKATINVRKVTNEFKYDWVDSNAYLEVSVSSAPGLDTAIPDHFRIGLVRVTNEHGQEIETSKPVRGYGNYFGYGLHSYGLKIPKDTKSLNLTFAYQESRFADFTTKPEAVSSIQNQPSN